MKKHLATIGIFTLLVIFPMVSWYYLRTGIDYRKRLLKETNPYGKIENFYSCDTLPFKSKTTIINFGELSKQVRSDLNEQFKDGRGYIVVDSDSSCIIPNDSISSKSKMFLVDTLLRLRSTYDSYDKNSIKLLVEHLSLVIPPEQKKELKLK